MCSMCMVGLDRCCLIIKGLMLGQALPPPLVLALVRRV
jgi:hypothetical protein